MHPVLPQQMTGPEDFKDERLVFMLDRAGALVVWAVTT
jgi:hypothetical protein